ncbi:hypothetical protein QJS04_geneDACA001955 [Acorus gramineus]|uniref:Uncharacterized protein n=1 Tax=Acorus gramineus TaxID=55184 RepID=A0AAV9A800_ACOGR|nr:hypothetical protein QJS04_geneDACA001955 [Acorus gramineus]
MASTKKVNDILYIEQSASAYYQENLMLFAKGEGLEYTNTLSLVTSIDLSSNDLSGDIPAQLMNLFGLRFLNLSTNKLTGVIPQNIGGLSQLESLDLSVNQLSGEIPSSMSTLTSLAYLNLSYNELSGRIPIGNQLQTLTDPSIYIGNPKLCGNPLPMCPRDEASTPRSGGEADAESEMIWFYIGFAPGLAAGFWGIMGVLFLKRSWRLSLFRFFDEIWDWVYVAVSVKLASWRDYRARAATT